MKKHTEKFPYLKEAGALNGEIDDTELTISTLIARAQVRFPEVKAVIAAIHSEGFKIVKATPKFVEVFEDKDITMSDEEFEKIWHGGKTPGELFKNEESRISNFSGKVFYSDKEE